MEILKEVHMGRTACLCVLVSLAVLTGCSGGAKPYPLETCLVTDNILGSMGDPVSFDYEGQEITVCCKPCIKKFRRDPGKFLEKLRQLTSANAGSS